MIATDKISMKFQEGREVTFLEVDQITNKLANGLAALGVKKPDTVLLVKQNAVIALRVARKGYVLETGNIVLFGGTKELLENEYVKKAYLGQWVRSSIDVQTFNSSKALGPQLSRLQRR